MFLINWYGNVSVLCPEMTFAVNWSHLNKFNLIQSSNNSRQQDEIIRVQNFVVEVGGRYASMKEMGSLQFLKEPFDLSALKP